MTFSFRLPFTIPEGTGLEDESSAMILESDGAVEVRLHAADGSTISAAWSFELRGDGYTTEDLAASEGQRWWDWLTLSLMQYRIGADYGFVGASGHVTRVGQKYVFGNGHKVQVIPEIPGLTVFPTEPAARFAIIGRPTVRGWTNAGLVVQALGIARGERKALDDRLRLACNIYGLASFLSGEARFLSLVIALESLIVEARRPSDQIVMIDEIIEHVRQSSLASPSADSMMGALREMKRQSIRASGKELVGILEGSEYMGMPVRRFWDHIYDIRSRVSHGGLDSHSSVLASTATPEVGKLVADLIDALSRELDSQVRRNDGGGRV